MELMELIRLAAWVSAVFFASWCAALVVAEMWRHLWNWVDDHAKPITSNPLMSWARTFFRNGDSWDVWIFIVLATLWPIYLTGVAVFFSARGARGLRRRYKNRPTAAVSA
ncbi:hypothetical protein [Pseudomonas lurida]|uniref:hypothetical protein n=1 Tax=Pseudomonas lurida TaxID=244566 RepID=UPI00177D07C1|nr:hypothetical protein [Pseudomonas lurida]MBD8671579.1 hypothetical protein [Pseudomonas lurida]